jgi:glycosyltransferase involved in cell wall biosynthesis
MERSFPRVSFLVPARNEERFIGACIESLRGQLRDVDGEIVVIDNGSTDATPVRAMEWGARVVEEGRPGLARARQAGLAAARGEIIIYVDADTRLPKGWAEHIVRLFDGDRGLVALSSSFSFHDGRTRDDIGNFLFKTVLCPITNVALRRTGRPGVLIGSAIAVRSEALRRAGGIDMGFQFYGEDTMLARRLHSQGDVRFLRKPIHLTSARRYQQRGIFNVIYRYFLIFAMIHLGKVDTASRLARRYHFCDRRTRDIKMCRPRLIPAWRTKGKRGLVAKPAIAPPGRRDRRLVPDSDHFPAAELAPLTMIDANEPIYFVATTPQ